MSAMQRLARRVANDYSGRDDLPKYRQTLCELQASNVAFVTVSEYAHLVRRSETLPRRCCVFRIDVDSDPDTAEDMAKMAQALGVRQTYYFRLCTLQSETVRRVHAMGHEVGYHFEEIATYAKRHRITTGDAVLLQLERIRVELRKNLQKFHALSGVAPTSVASHGDFMNRKLNLTNSILIDDSIRSEFNLTCEAYDRDLVARFDSIITDSNGMWRPKSPAQAITEGATCMRVLVHPRAWRANIAWNLRFDLVRIWQGAIVRLLHQ